MKIIKQATVVEAAGTPAKKIEEFIGRVNSSTDELSIARMTSPTGWSEPGQTPEFNEYTYVLKGKLLVETREGSFEVQANELVLTNKGEWVRYSTPFEGGAEYIAICSPAFSMDRVRRDQEDQ
jgi:mannose-6-phosphate isomerase-like protein (cupin superfamily)